MNNTTIQKAKEKKEQTSVTLKNSIFTMCTKTKDKMNHAQMYIQGYGKLLSVNSSIK